MPMLTKFQFIVGEESNRAMAPMHPSQRHLLHQGPGAQAEVSTKCPIFWRVVPEHASSFRKEALTHKTPRNQGAPNRVSGRILHPLPITGIFLLCNQPQQQDLWGVPLGLTLINKQCWQSGTFHQKLALDPCPQCNTSVDLTSWQGSMQYRKNSHFSRIAQAKPLPAGMSPPA